MYKNAKKLKLDIACGNRKKNGFLGVDVCNNADIICNLEIFPWPFDDSTVDEVYCSHYIEHTSDLIAFFNELYRIMKPGATAEIIAPYYSSIKAWQDPTHVRAISENTYYYCNREWRLINKLGHYPIIADFNYVCDLSLAAEWENKDKNELLYAIRHYMNVVHSISTILTKKGSTDQERFKKNETVAQLWREGNVVEASSVCKKLIESDLADFFTWLVLGEYALHSGDYILAIDVFKNALKLEFDSKMAHAGFVVANNKAGHKREAELHLDRLTDLDPDFSEDVKMVIRLITEGD